MKIIICGFGSAGYAAAMSVKRNSPKDEIIIIDPKEKDLMHPCGLPYALEKIVSPENLLQDIGLQKSGIIKLNGKAVKILPDSKVVVYHCSEIENKESYDAIIIATGNRAVIPPVKGVEELLNKSVFTLIGVSDLTKIIESTAGKKNFTVIGGGAIGIETAYALKQLDKEVTLVEMKEQLLPGVLDPDMSAGYEDYLSSAGISIHKGSSAVEFISFKENIRIICSDKEINTDIVIIAAGFSPDTSMAENSGISFDKSGIITDSYLCTSAISVFAAGDCISGWSTIDGKRVSSRLATSAYKQGTIAGLNALGGKNEYRGTASTFVTRTGSYEIAGTGFNTVTAAERGFEPLAGRITSKIRPDYYPDNSDITVKIIFDKNSGTILGAQCAGKEGSASRINVISMAVEFGITIDELWRTELAYCPSVSEVYDPLLRAADIGLRRMRR